MKAGGSSQVSGRRTSSQDLSINDVSSLFEGIAHPTFKTHVRAARKISSRKTSNPGNVSMKLAVLVLLDARAQEYLQATGLLPTSSLWCNLCCLDLISTRHFSS